METGRIIAQRYRVGRKLGEGGMGAVFEAEHVVTHKKLAIKVLEKRESLPQEEVNRFLREARAPARIGHPNVVEVIDAGTDPDGTAFIVMELLDGETLDEVVKRDRVVQPAVLSAVMDQLLSALDAMHARGFVHRDLKPANIFLARTPSSPMHVKLLDFGIAKDVGEESRTRSGYVMGTPAYMAPEQMRNARNATARSDLWSVGVILYESLVGHRPFRGDTFGLLAAIAGPQRHVPLADVAPHLPTELTELVDLLLSKDLSLRPGSAAGVRANLLPALARCPEVYPLDPADDLGSSENRSNPSDSQRSWDMGEDDRALRSRESRRSLDGSPRRSSRETVSDRPPEPPGFFSANRVAIGLGSLILIASVVTVLVLQARENVTHSGPRAGTGTAPRTHALAEIPELDSFGRRWLATIVGSQGAASVTPFYADRAAFRVGTSELATPQVVQRRWQEVFADGGSFAIDWERSQWSEEPADLNAGVSAACINLTGATGRVFKLRAWATELSPRRIPAIGCQRLEGVYLVRLRRVNGALRICHETWSMREGICASCPTAPVCAGGGAQRQ